MFELNNSIDAKLTRLGELIDTNIMQNFIVFGISTIFLIIPEQTEDLPEFLGLDPSQYIILIPLILVFLFVKFGFVSLRFLQLIAERDKTILKMVDGMENKKEHLIRLKNVYRLSSFGEVFYKTLIFKGVEINGYKEELTKAFKPFTFIWIIFIIVTNTLLSFFFLDIYFDEKQYYFLISLSIGILIIIGCYVDYFKKIRHIKKDINEFYAEWKDQNPEL